MGLRFVVGDAQAALGESFGASVDAALRTRFPDVASPGGARAGSDALYESDDLPLAGWRALQSRVASLMQAPQVTAIDIYLAAWLPAGDDEILELAVSNAADPLQVGSLPALIAQLRDFASRASLPVDDVELMALANRYLEDDDLADRDLDVQTYIQLLLTAKQALAAMRPMWCASR